MSVAMIDDEHLDRFARHGFVVIEGTLPSELIESLRGSVEELQRWAEEPSGLALHHFEQTDAGPAIARSEFFADVHADLGDFVRRGPIIDGLTGLFGEDPVLFKEKINYKHPGGAGFAPHQDATAYRFVDHHISVMVPLDPATEASGCLWFADGFELGQLPTDSRGRVRDDIAESLPWVPVPVQPGDVVFFDSYAPHYSDSNLTTSPRRALYLTYNAASLGDHRDAYYSDKLSEFETAGDAFGDGDDARVRMSISDDFLGRPAEVNR